MCHICNNESGGKDVGVAAIPGVPMSIMWCDECLKRDTAPSFVFDHDWSYVAFGDLDNLNDWAKQRETWHDGRYMSFTEYIKTIPPEQVEKDIAEYEAAMRGEEIDVKEIENIGNEEGSVS